MSVDKPNPLSLCISHAHTLTVVLTLYVAWVGLVLLKTTCTRTGVVGVGGERDTHTKIH